MRAQMKIEEVDNGDKVEITTVGQKEELERFVQVCVRVHVLSRVCARVPLAIAQWALYVPSLVYALSHSCVCARYGISCVRALSSLSCVSTLWSLSCVRARAWRNGEEGAGPALTSVLVVVLAGAGDGEVDSARRKGHGARP